MERSLTPVEQSGAGIIRILRPIVSVREAVDAWNEYQDLCTALLTNEDFQDIRGKRFKKKSAWRKLGNVFAISVVPLSGEKVRADPSDPTSQIVYAEWTVQATAPNGRTMVGWGACSLHEPRNFEKPDHDIPATAMTRAINRAISDLVGAGEVSAEEVEADAGQGFDRAAAKVIAGGQLATPAQVKAIYVIARNERTLSEEETDAICHRLYGNRAPAELGKREASEFIDKLKSKNELVPRTSTAEAPAPAPQTPPPAPAPATSGLAPTDDWTTFWTTTKKLGYADAKAVHAALGVANINDWINRGGTQASAIDVLTKLAG